MFILFKITVQSTVTGDTFRDRDGGVGRERAISISSICYFFLI